MNILLIAQCQKRALKETRRILDQFAERKGERTWQTPITKAGLNTLRTLLRKRARRNTAVACHWIRSKDHSELLWIVGNASRFNDNGTVPTNITRRDILRQEDENNWHALDQIRWLASMAALFHDVGKATDAFQQRLRGQREGRNRYRHEWISLRLLEAFVGQDDDSQWLQRLASAEGCQPQHWLKTLRRDGIDPLDATSDARTPFRCLPPLAQAIGWLIVSHHRLPLKPSIDDKGVQQWLGKNELGWQNELTQGLANVSAAWNEVELRESLEDLPPWWQCSRGLPVGEKLWHKRAIRLVTQAFKANWWNSRETPPPLDSPYVMHLARLCLMMADHHYSSLRIGKSDHFVAKTLYANTQSSQPPWPETPHSIPNQTLLDHLLGVTRCTGEIVHRLPSLLSGLRGITQHRRFRQRSREARFKWQDKAFDLASTLQARSEQQGFFGINMASTGCGKTLANGRIMYALGHPRRGARFTIALGLRTLTLQTGESYRKHMQLSEHDLAIRVGGSAQMAMYEHMQNDQESPSGSSSDTSLLDDDSVIDHTDSTDSHPLLTTFLHDPKAQQFVSAPIMVCTIDHLMPATESLRGGRQIAPMLRLMTSDLILDEPDDFGIEDLPALTRLVYWTGLLGSRVLLSSATLPPTLIQGLYEAYYAGRTQFQRHQGDPSAPQAICCAWFDEQDHSTKECADPRMFKEQHNIFAKQRTHFLAEQTQILRTGRVAPLENITSRSEDTLYAQLCDALLSEARTLHEAHHSVSTQGQRVSFGLIRLANINPLVAIAKQLFTHQPYQDMHIHLCVYHSQFPLLMRSRKEQMLDSVLDRHNAKAVFNHPSVAPLLAKSPDKEHLFIVLGSPVTEVGRDHDYDWAIVEPSSVRSIIQLAGRIQRHRCVPPSTPNVVLLNRNLSTLKHGDKAASFMRPGFETKTYWCLPKHQLDQGLLPKGLLEHIDARPRLCHPRLRGQLPGAACYLYPDDTLNSLEHQRIGYTMLAHFQKRYSPPIPAGAFSCHDTPSALLTGVLQQHQPFRKQTGKQVDLALVVTDDDNAEQLRRIEPQPGRQPHLYVPVERSMQRVSLELAHGIDAWGDSDYLSALETLADEMEMSNEACSKRFGIISLRELDTGERWAYHPVLGFSKD